MRSRRTKQVLITVIGVIIYVVLRCLPLVGLGFHEFFARLVSGSPSYKLSVVGLGLTPYLHANIILMLLVVAFRKQVESRFRNPDKAILAGTLLVALLNAFSNALLITKTQYLYHETLPIFLPANLFVAVATVTQTVGVFFLLLLGVLITEHGIGHGLSLLYVLPMVELLLRDLSRARLSLDKIHADRIPVLLWIMGMVALAWLTKRALDYNIKIAVRLSHNIPNKEKAFLEVPLSLAGFLPLLLAGQLLHFFSSLIALNPSSNRTSLLNTVSMFLEKSEWIGTSITYALMVLFFTYFVLALLGTDWVKRFENLEKMGLVIPGVKPGQPTVKYLDHRITRVGLVWGGFLIALWWLWMLIPYGLHLPATKLLGRDFLLVVGVCVAIWKTCRSRPHQKAVYQSNDIGELLTLKALLGCHAVEAIIDDREALGRLYPVTIGQLGVKRILVDEASFAKAKEIVPNATNN